MAFLHTGPNYFSPYGQLISTFPLWETRSCLVLSLHDGCTDHINANTPTMHLCGWHPLIPQCIAESRHYKQEDVFPAAEISFCFMGSDIKLRGGSLLSKATWTLKPIFTFFICKEFSFRRLNWSKSGGYYEWDYTPICKCIENQTASQEIFVFVSLLHLFTSIADTSGLAPRPAAARKNNVVGTDKRTV